MNVATSPSPPPRKIEVAPANICRSTEALRHRTTNPRHANLLVAIEAANRSNRKEDIVWFVLAISALLLLLLTLAH